MIDVQRVAEGDPLEFEVVVRRKGRDPSPRDDVARDVRAADSRQAHARTLYRGGLPLLARPRTGGVDSRTVRRDGDLALLPEFERELPRYLSRS
jgi:hypothetical protein